MLPMHLAVLCFAGFHLAMPYQYPPLSLSLSFPLVCLGRSVPQTQATTSIRHSLGPLRNSIIPQTARRNLRKGHNPSVRRLAYTLDAHFTEVPPYTQKRNLTTKSRAAIISQNSKRTIAHRTVSLCRFAPATPSRVHGTVGKKEALPSLATFPQPA